MPIKREVIINGINVSSCEELCSDAVHPSCYHLNGCLLDAIAHLIEDIIKSAKDINVPHKKEGE